MAPRDDWIPRKDGEFDAFYKRYCQIVDRKTSGQSPEWTHIPAGRVVELDAGYALWYAAWSRLGTVHGSADVLAKNEARAAGKKTLREFNNQYVLYAREVSDAEKKEAGAHVQDATGTPAPRPQDQPEADITYPGRHLIELVRIRPVTGGTDDPRSGWGVRIHYGILDGAEGGQSPHFPGGVPSAKRHRIASPPVTGEDLPHSVFIHKKKYRFDFDGDSGKTVYFCLRYENGKGGEEGEGPFGPILQAIIP